MNPNKNILEPLFYNGKALKDAPQKLYCADGSEVPDHWSIFSVGEIYTINNYSFKCAYLGKTSILFEPVGPILLLTKEDESNKK